MPDAVPPSPSPVRRPKGGPSLRDAMAEAARVKPSQPRWRLWIWVAVVAIGVVVLLLQLLGVTRSPVEEKLLRDRPPVPAPAQPGSR